MRVGFVGLGKLGLPVATAMALRGADVMGYDVDANRMSHAPQPYLETGPDGTGDFNDWLKECGRKEQWLVPLEHARPPGRLRFGTLAEVAAHAEILFVAVQTPHDPRFGGETVLRDQPVDFDYSHLKDAVRNVAREKIAFDKSREIDYPDPDYPENEPVPLPLAVISTVLPGTMAREITPLIHGTGLKLVYNPHFIAMGTTMRDFLNPEFVLLGVDDEWAAERVEEFYTQTLGIAQEVEPRRLPLVVKRMSVASAELTKVAYNTFISTKIAVANALMEICHKTPGANIDEVSGALKAATKRVASGMYMDGGMGDGGGCHPRDNIALSWLARKLELSYDPFNAAMRAREDQSAWLARLCFSEYLKAKAARIVIAGYAFKPGTNITTGSPALLLAAQLQEAFGVTVEMWDPHVRGRDKFPFPFDGERVVVLLGCRHPEFEGWTGESLGGGSVVIDPHRMTGKAAAGVRIVRVGEGN